MRDFSAVQVCHMCRPFIGEVTNVQKMEFGLLQRLSSSVIVRLLWSGARRKDECVGEIGMIPLCLSRFCLVYTSM